MNEINAYIQTFPEKVRSILAQIHRQMLAFLVEKKNSNHNIYPNKNSFTHNTFPYSGKLSNEF